MKLILLLLLLISSSTSNAKPLQCSAHGTDVYYINGVLTNDKKNKDDTKEIRTLFDGKNNQLDSGPLIAGKSPVTFTGIFNPSFGLINDAAELFSQAYYAKTGKDDGKAIFNLIQNMPDALVGIATGFDPNDFGSVVGMFGLKTPTNFATLIFQAKEDIKTATVRSLASTETLLTEKELVINGIANGVVRSQKANRKILFVAHSQGNAVLAAGIQKLTVANVPTEIEYMQKFMGAYYVASPVPPLTSPYKAKSIRLDQDHVITAAQLFSFSLPFEYQTSAAPITHNLTSRTAISSDGSGHFFTDTYISPDVYARPVNTNDTPVRMSETFVATLSDLATELEDNCNSPDIDIEVNGAIRNPTNSLQFDYQDFTNFNKSISIKGIDKNDSDNSTIFTFSYRTYCADCEPSNRWAFKTQENVRSISDFSIPFTTSQTSGRYLLDLLATNKFGKATRRTFLIAVPKDQPATIKLVSQVCYPDCSYGCEGAIGIPYVAHLSVSDSDSSEVIIRNSLDNTIGRANTAEYSGQMNFIYSNPSPPSELTTLTLFSGALTTSYTIPACVP